MWLNVEDQLQVELFFAVGQSKPLHQYCTDHGLNYKTVFELLFKSFTMKMLLKHYETPVNLSTPQRENAIKAVKTCFSEEEEKRKRRNELRKNRWANNPASASDRDARNEARRRERANNPASASERDARNVARRRALVDLKANDHVEAARIQRQNTVQHKAKWDERKRKISELIDASPSNDGGVGSSSDETVGAAGRPGNSVSDTTDSGSDSGSPADNGNGMNVDENDVFSQDLSDTESDDRSGDAEDQVDDREWCRNCCRKQFVDDDSSPYHIEFRRGIDWKRIKKLPSKLKMVQHSAITPPDKHYTLCIQCCNFIWSPDRGIGDDGVLIEPNVASEPELDKARYEWKNIWPSSFWNLISGRDATTGVPFHAGSECGLYGGPDIWKFIPESLRPYWLWVLSPTSGVELRPYSNNSIDHAEYDQCTLTSPPSVFHDGTGEIERASIESKGLASLLRKYDPTRLPHRQVIEPYWNLERRTPKANLPKGISPAVCSAIMNSPVESNAYHQDVEDYVRLLKPLNLPTVRCPWGCGEFPLRACLCDPSLLIQIQLRKVQLNIIYQAHWRRCINSVRLKAPGAVVVIQDPDPIKTWLGKGSNMPIMDITGPFRVVNKGSITMKPVPIVTASLKQHAFHLVGAKIRVLNWYPLDTNCGGLMCDGLGKQGFPILYLF